MRAYRCLGEKNRLTAADAQRIEEAFQAKLATLATDEADQPKTPAQSLTSQPQNARKSKNRPRSKGIDKGVLTLPEPRGHRSMLASASRNGRAASAAPVRSANAL
jgi:hypothetical protein